MPHEAVETIPHFAPTGNRINDCFLGLSRLVLQTG
jgi:hypothetical protein